ncbi:putative F-box protein At3g19560 [Eucalyptus grandis]|uniref:putative F-box protein At3g19560 n=1 Tax=Eucalyptus grandis TaxID=71139 RepID=UPI00192EF884|nr:putative F-box protein At3g19560 [Eucalyptus grandis]
MEGLSDDLITKILERVPKKPLLGFRCMSKQWCRLIDERFYRKSLLYLFPMFSSSLYCIDLRWPGDFEEIENPLVWERIVLLGSCRGFLCIYNEDNGQVAIWNPSTRWCKHLPPADAEIAHRLGSLLAFTDLGMTIGMMSSYC